VGTSNWQNISHCVGTLRRLMPASVLDVGTGFGRWGMLCREFLDAWEGREARALWKVRIDGIEAFPSCLTPLHGYIYDRIFVGDAVDVLPSLGVYDVIYLGDVVEHQTKPRALALLDAAVRHARKAAIVTIPIGDNWPQEVGADGNWFHAHRSTWELDDFDCYPGAIRQPFSDYHGRLYLVIEIPGRAGDGPSSGDRVGLEVVAAAEERLLAAADEHRAGEGTGPATSFAGSVELDALLARLDEHTAVDGLIDDERNRGEVSQTLLHQLPASAEIRRRIDQLSFEGFPWVPPFTAMVDELYRLLIEHDDRRPSDERSFLPSAEAAAVLDRLAVALSSLTLHACGQAHVVSLLRDMRSELETLKTASMTELLAASHSSAGGRRH